MGVCLLPDDRDYQLKDSSIMLHHRPFKRPRVSQPSSILGKPFEDVEAHYSLGKELGRGVYRVTYSCTENSTGCSYACKSIPKPKLPSDGDALRREVHILQRLVGRPNIIQFKGAYEDLLYVHIVMELCTHGNLYDNLGKKGRYTEEEAASMCRVIVSALQTCHSMGVIHGDVKLDNILLSSSGKGKLADFGLSFFFEEGKLRSDPIGTLNDLAPEVLVSSYGKEIDIWSTGVILYTLLDGEDFPFVAESGEDTDLFTIIMKGKPDFERAPWPTISSSAKDLVRKMLTKDLKVQITCSQLLEHPWITGHGKASQEVGTQGMEAK